MAVPPLGATGVDKSDPATFGAGSGFLAPSSMAAPEAYREDVSAKAVDRPRDEQTPEDDGPKRLDEGKALELLRDASNQSRSFFETHVHSSWQRSYRAVRNEHFAGSLYLSEAYKTRSKIFKPKTRSALWKRLASTTKAMFTHGDVISVMAEDETNQQQVASASLKQELLNYRLSTPTLRNGIPWFLTATGARFDAEVTRICCSKQFWNYKEIDTGKVEMVDEVDPQTGAPSRTMRPKKLVLIDKPDVMLMSPENVRFDPNSNWTNVAQLSPYLLLQFPMTPDEALDMIRQNGRSTIPWRSGITIEMLKGRSGTNTPSETTGPRSARSGGQDPQQQTSGAFRTVWLTEVFMRHEGRDYTFWAVNDQMLLSDPRPVEEVYPWCYGERPVTIGMGQLEPHRTYGMSAVESWQQLQQELNDGANLRLDYEKRIVSPPMRVLRGKKVDLQQVQRKGANSIIMTEGPDDVEPLQMPDVPQSVFQEATMLATDFDDLAGNFNASSVQTNRQLNETVGGMHLLAEAGNQVSDFDLSVWGETWVQPTILQLLKLEEYYETDEKVLAVCGERAKLWERFGVNEITDELLRSETTAKVNIGIGATALPMERLSKLATVYDVAAKILAPFVQTKLVEIVPDAKSIVDECFAAGGFRDGGKRFFKYVGPPQQPDQPPPPDPKAQAAMMQAQAKMQGNQIQQEKNQGQMLLDAHKLQDSKAMDRAHLVNAAADRRAGLEMTHMKTMAELARAEHGHAHTGSIKALEHAHQHQQAMMSPFLEALAAHLGPQPAGDKAAGPRGDPSVPMLAPRPTPRSQPQPGMFATVESALPPPAGR